MITEFEDKYLDVLQNIEWCLISPMKEHPELCDHDMLRIVEQALAYYKSRQRGNTVEKSKFTDIRQGIFENILSICEWRLGEPSSSNKEISCNSIKIEELLLCLKRIKKSIKFWTKQGGRKGYINFASPQVLVSC